MLALTPNPVVIFPDGKPAEIESLIPGDLENDVVLIKVNRAWNSSATIAAQPTNEGESVYSVGFPMGCNVPIKSRGINVGNQDTKGFISVGTTLSTLPGSSGSGVFNGKDELVGIVKEAYVPPIYSRENSKTSSTWMTPLTAIQKIVAPNKKIRLTPCLIEMN